MGSRTILPTILILGLVGGWAVASAQRLTPTGIALERWSDSAFPINWRWNPTIPDNVSEVRPLGTVIRNAFTAWSNVASARATFTEGDVSSATDAGLDGINLISLVPNAFEGSAVSLAVIYSFDAPGSDPLSRPIQFPGQILEADILFNPELPFTTAQTPASGEYDLESRLVHDIGHLLGLDHSGLMGSSMFPHLERGRSLGRVLAADDRIRISALYPGPGFDQLGQITGVIRSDGGVPVFGAHVVIVDALGKPMTATVTDPNGRYHVAGLEPGDYSAFAQPLDSPITPSDLPSLADTFPGEAPSAAFTTRFAAASSEPAGLTLTKVAGDNQVGAAGQPLGAVLEVEVRDGSGDPVVGAPVRFAATSGGGAIVPVTATTDGQGRARATAYLGNGSTQAFTALGGDSGVAFSATRSTSTAAAAVNFLNPSSTGFVGEIVVVEGTTETVGLQVLDSGGAVIADPQVSYSTTNPAVATVDASGTIQALDAGFTTLRVSVDSLVAAATITVVEVNSASSTTDATGAAFDSASRLYLASPSKHVVYRADGPAQEPYVYAGVVDTPDLLNDVRLSSRFRNPGFVALDQSDGTLYVSDTSNHVIRRVQPGVGSPVETFAGSGQLGQQDGPRGTASFNSPRGIALDNAGGLWVADTGNHTIRRIDLVSGIVSTVAGQVLLPGEADGSGDQAAFDGPVGIALNVEPVADQSERFFRGDPPPPLSMVVADTGNGTIRRVTISGNVSTVSVLASVNALSLDSGSANAVSRALGALRFAAPTGIVVDAVGNIHFTDPTTNQVRTILPNGDVVSALPAGRLSGPAGLAIGRAGRLLVTSANRLAEEVVFGRPVITSVTPDQGASTGGTTVTIIGRNFAPGTRVVIEGTVISSPTFVDTETIRFTTPELPSGRVTMTVMNRAGLAQTEFLAEPPTLSQLSPAQVTTVAGGGNFAGDGDLATTAHLSTPTDAAVDSSGNIYITDLSNSRIRRIDSTTQSLNTIAGTGVRGYSGDNGLAIAAALGDPQGIVVDGAGNFFFVDTVSSSVRKIDSQTGIITKIAGGGQGYSGDNGPALNAQLFNPQGIAVDTSGNLYIADSQNNRIRRIDGQTGIITTIAGSNGQFCGPTSSDCFSGDNGAATAASLNYPQGMVVDASGNVYFADTFNHRIRKVDTTGVITTIAGSSRGYSGDNGAAVSAQLNSPADVDLDANGNIYVADGGNSVIRRIDSQTGIITTVAGMLGGGFEGDDGPATSARLFRPECVVVDSSGSILICDSANNRIRKVDFATGVISTIAGSSSDDFLGEGGPATAARLGHVYGVGVDGVGNLFMIDRTNSLVRRVDSTGNIVTVAGGGTNRDDAPVAALSANLNSAEGIAVDSVGNIYIADTYANRIRRVDSQTGIISTIAGSSSRSGFAGDNGPATEATLIWPRAVAVDASNNIFIADESNRIRKIDGGSGIITTVAGNSTQTGFAGGGFSGDNELAVSSTLSLPRGVAVDTQGNVFISDTFNGRIRKVAADTGIITTLAEGVTSEGITLDSLGNVFVSSVGGPIFKIDSNTLVVGTVGGVGGSFSGDGGPVSAAGFNVPRGLAFDPAGNLFIADSFNNAVRAVKGPLP